MASSIFHFGSHPIFSLINVISSMLEGTSRALASSYCTEGSIPVTRDMIWISSLRDNPFPLPTLNILSSEMDGHPGHSSSKVRPAGTGSGLHTWKSYTRIRFSGQTLQTPVQGMVSRRWVFGKKAIATGNSGAGRRQAPGKSSLGGHGNFHQNFTKYWHGVNGKKEYWCSLHPRAYVFFTGP